MGSERNVVVRADETASPAPDWMSRIGVALSAGVAGVLGLPLLCAGFTFDQGVFSAIADTLAHAHFKAGDATRAVETERRAVRLAKESPRREEAEAALRKFQQATERSESPVAERAGTE